MPLAHHATKIKQELGIEALSGAHDDNFFQAQLLRSISLALSAVGFDGADPAALEAFRAEAATFMQYFLSVVRSSMISNRRLQPLPQDFVTALADIDILPHELMAHVKLKLPSYITQPPIAPAEHDDPTSENTKSLLGEQLAEPTSRMKWLPAHLPDLPSVHTYKKTPIYTKREDNARRIRELATEEGVLAEQAMRKLLINGGHGHAKVPFATKRAEQVWEQTMEALTKMDNAQKAKDEHEEFDDFGGHQQDEYANAMLVNYESRYWRKGARGP